MPKDTRDLSGPQPARTDKSPESTTELVACMQVDCWLLAGRLGDLSADAEKPLLFNEAARRVIEFRQFLIGIEREVKEAERGKF